MRAPDHDHAHVRRAFDNYRWTNTHDALRLRRDVEDLYVDPVEERLIAAEKGPEGLQSQLSSCKVLRRSTSLRRSSINSHIIPIFSKGSNRTASCISL
ncbi:MAG: hypothetical protein IPM54_31105 [Polyangiaceae bacterium]|nr:hypothetical protein [Polyangiaceae bacterium]